MKKIILLFLFYTTIFLNAQDKKTFYHLKVISSSKASVHCFINGFPVFETLSFSRAANNTPINLYLICTNNSLEVTLDGTVDDISVEGNISTYNEGEMVDAADGKDGIAPFKLSGKNQNANVSFNNTGPDFSYLFKNAPILTNEKLVKEYAKALLQLLKDKNTKALADEMSPKFKDYAKVYGKSEEHFRTEFETFFDNTFLKQPEEVSPASPVIVLTPLCQKRIYKVCLENKKALFVRGHYSFQIYVAMIDGKLKVVR